MPSSTGSLTLLKCAEDAQYDGSLKEKESSRVSWHIIITSVAFLSVVGILVKVLVFNQPNTHYNREDDALLYQYIYVSPAAAQLPLSGKLFCWVQTAPMYHDSRAVAVNETWLSRCDHGQLFTSGTFEDPRIPYSTVFAGIPESYYNLFFKSRFAFRYIWENISHDFDWYMKADDDTYVIVEHLRKYLATLDPSKPYYLGYALKPYLVHAFPANKTCSIQANGYNAGGAGYVLSKEALRLFNEFAYFNESLCPDNIYEDVGIGNCLANLGIFPHDTRNRKALNRFYQYTPADMFHATKTSPKWTKYLEGKGYGAFATDVISFHHLTPDEIRVFDILLYRTDNPRH